MKQTKFLIARCLTLLVLALLSTNLAWGKTGDLLCGGSFVGSFPNNESWTGSDEDYYSGNGYKFDQNETLQSPNLVTGVKKVTIKILVGHNGGATSTLKVGAYNSSNELLAESDNIVPTVAYTAQTDEAIQEFTLDGGVTDIKYIKLSFTKVKNYGMKTLEVYDATGTITKKLVSIAISGTPTKTTYEAGEEFDPAGLTVTGTYDTGDPEVITSGIDWTLTPNPLTIETTSVSVTATVSGKSDTKNYDVTVKASEGDKLTQASTGVTGTTYTEWSGKTGSEGVAVYAGKSAGSYNSIQLNTTNPQGIVSTTSGGLIRKVKVDWNTNTSSTGNRSIDIYGSNTAYTGSGDIYDNEKQGTKLGSIVCGTSTELEVEGDYEYVGIRAIGGALYMNSITFIWSAPKELTSIAVKTAPTTLTYAAGEFFKPAGLVITATYTDSSTEDIAYESNEDKFSFSPALDAALATTDEKVTITYGGKSCNQAITVKNIDLTSIVVSGDLSKTEYIEGDDFDFTGLVATGFYSDDTNKTITDQVEWSIDPATLTAGQTSVSVIATSGSISGNKSYDITVAAAPQIATFSGDAGADVTFATGSSSADKAVWACSPCAKGIITLTGAVTSGSNYSYYDGSVVRFYTNNNLVLTPANGYKITKVEIVRQTTTSSNGGTINCEGLTADENNTTTNTNIFTGSTKGAVTFTVTAQARFTSISVHYATAAPATATPTITPSVEADAYFEPITVTLASATEGAAIYYTSNGDAPTTASKLYENPIAVSATTTIKAIAVKDGLDNSDVVSKTFTFGPIYNSLANLVAAEITSGTIVKVSFENAKITGFYTNSQGKRYGVYLNTQKDDKDIEIYCNTAEHPDIWVANGKLSGTLVGAWKEFNGTWEICPNSWEGLEYTAPSKQNPTISASYKTSLVINEDDEYIVEYNGDGELSITSSDEGVAEATIGDDNKVTITAKAAGTTTITISAAETDNNYAVSKEYTLKVIAPASLPFAFDGGIADIETTAGMSQMGLGSDYSGSPKLKFDGANDNLVIWFDGQADYVSYDIKRNGSGSNAWAGTFEVMESADGNTYTPLASYTALGAKETETNVLKSDTRYVKFVYTTKTTGNVALGNIKIGKAYKATITDAKYATLGLPYAATIPEGVSAYTATVSGSTVTMTKISGGVIPANCGVILYAETPGDYTFTQTLPPNLYVENKLVAVVSGPYTCTEADEGKVYYLGKDGDKATFKKLNLGGTIAAGKAYLKLDAAISAAKLDVTFGEPTGITSYENDNENENLKSMTVYNLNGMKVNEHYKGIVIMNGKKYINK